MGLEGRVELVGHVSDSELALWHRAADVFVLPTVAYVGFGLVTAEALASGTPVVGTRVGATPELLEPLDPRLLAHGTDPEDLAEATGTGPRLATPGASRALSGVRPRPPLLEGRAARVGARARTGQSGPRD